MDTEDSSVSSIRETSRNQLKLNRRFHRDEETDIRRSVENYSVTIEDITQIAEKLKTKSPISVQELQTLKNGLLHQPGAVETVLGTAGALRGLVRELSGSDIKKSIAAAACCCNVSLEGGRAALQVGKAAGPYLVTAAHSLTDELALTSAWCLGNISDSPAAASLLLCQGAVSALCELVSRPGDVRDAALYGLLHITYHATDTLGTEHLNKILQSLHDIDFTSLSAQLLFVISCHEHFQLSQNQLGKVLEYLKISIEKHSKCVRKKSCCELVYLIRTLANVRLCEDSYKMIISHLWNISDSVKMLLFSDMEQSLKLSLMWFLGNLYNFNKNEQLFGKLLN